MPVSVLSPRWTAVATASADDLHLDLKSAALFAQGECVTSMLAAQPDSLSVLPTTVQVLPVFVSDVLWGALSFDFSDASTLLQPDQINALSSFIIGLGVALQRQQDLCRSLVEKTAESRFRDLLETIEDLIWEVDEQAVYTYVSPQVKKLLGYAPEEVIGQKLDALMLVDQQSLASAIIRRCVSQHQGFSRVEVRRLSKAGRQIVVESNGVPFFDDQGNFKGYRGIDRDVTDRKAAEVELYHQHCLIELRAMVDSILARNIPLPQMLDQCTTILVQQLNVGVVRVWTLNPDTQMLELRSSAGHCIDSDHYYRRVAMGDLAIGFIAKSRCPLLTNDVQSESHIQRKNWALEAGLKAFAGYPLIVNEQLIGVISLFAQQDLPDDTLEMLSFIAGEIAEGIHRKQSEAALAKSEAQLRRKADALKLTLSKLRKTQAQLVQSEKMSSLGQLVAGIAHEINNPVNFIQGNVRYSQDYFGSLVQAVALYQQEHPTPSPTLLAALDELDLPFIQRDLPKVLASMEMGADRIQTIVSTLKVFACLDETGVKPIDVQSGLDSALMILRSRFSENPAHIRIAVERDYGDVVMVNGVVGHLNQVFMNLLTNAVDALHDAVARQIQLVPKIMIRTVQLNADQVRVEISDNAGGMSQAVQKQIFDPFFTTKPIGQGTGLGLSTCYQIVVNEHHGQISCDSQVGEGTRFILHLPTAAMALTPVV
ncbi:PAS domain S-box protein [filamentous cyanobacterium LEGE 11480]|uniref:histidine kinase n=2 Tax=Romeriopsis TaxID=2992131 RepID=A0A928VR33_9CYAN|nr:PAS domain S-box protein [Romeriopsis navalis LEGE 11480]